jgi:dihydrolipoamide dehydrogenase
MMENYDVAVIGGGPGGYVAAIRAAQLGKNVALVEREHLGGICLNWGCIPTKSLLKSAEIFHLIKDADQFGINVPAPTIDIKKVVERSRNISSALTNGIKALLKKNKVTVIEGLGSIDNGKIINIDKNGIKTSIKSNNIIIATGARSRILKGFEPNGIDIWTSREAMIPNAIPKSIVIVGSGAIGIEFASFYNDIGAKVTILEAQNRILPVEDEEVSAFAHKIFEKKGIKIHTNIKLLKQTKSSDHITIDFEIDGKSQNIQAEKLLMAVGIVGNTENLNLEKTKVKIESNHIVTDKFMQTDEAGIYAIGDVTLPPWLAHKASHEGIIAAEHIAGLKTHPIIVSNIPSCTYSSPQIASIGLTEISAKKSHAIKVGKFPFMANGKALVLGEGDGFIKVIFDAKTGELLGAHLVGAEVTELIQGYSVAKNMEGTELDLINTIFPHPTLSEMMGEAVMQAYSRAIHI